MPIITLTVARAGPHNGAHGTPQREVTHMNMNMQFEGSGNPAAQLNIVCLKGAMRHGLQYLLVILTAIAAFFANAQSRANAASGPIPQFVNPSEVRAGSLLLKG